MPIWARGGPWAPLFFAASRPRCSSRVLAASRPCGLADPHCRRISGPAASICLLCPLARPALLGPFYWARLLGPFARPEKEKASASKARH